MWVGKKLESCVRQDQPLFSALTFIGRPRVFSSAFSSATVHFSSGLDVSMLPRRRGQRKSERWLCQLGSSTYPAYI